MVPARLVERHAGVTWEVPAFAVGHAERTAGAGGPGNGVLVGHVTSQGAGNVFGDLGRVGVGDQVRVFSGAQAFDYRVTEARAVARTDVSVVAPTEAASLSLITCTGRWLPDVGDFAERLVVRAELSDGETALAPPGAPPPPAFPATFRTVYDERPGQGAAGGAGGGRWPHDPAATAWNAEDGYRLVARRPGQFVALAAPVAAPLRDAAVTAAFRKVGGPPGGGYGLIVRDQGPGPRDGLNQSGRFYVFEAGDRGEVGVWRREGARWVDLLPWTPADAVRPGGAANELTVQAVGQRVTFLVNGRVVAESDRPRLGRRRGGRLRGRGLERGRARAVRPAGRRVAGSRPRPARSGSGIARRRRERMNATDGAAGAPGGPARLPVRVAIGGGLAAAGVAWAAMRLVRPRSRCGRCPSG